MRIENRVVHYHEQFFVEDRVHEGEKKRWCINIAEEARQSALCALLIIVFIQK
jgi:hypothetical protein